MAVVGVVTYGIVGLLFSAHIIVGRETGKQAYAAVFIILLVIGFFVYQGILKFEEWILSWPLYAKILVPSIMGCGILATIIILIVNRVKLKRANLSKDSNVEGE